MKLTLRPLFRSSSKKKNRSVSRSDPPSFGSGSSTSSSSSDLKETPKSVLQPNWCDFDSRLDEVVEIFKLIDRDGDGKISRLEVEHVFRRLGVEAPTEEELSVILAEADRDGDGCISLEEFGALSSALGPAAGDELRDAFDYFDADRDGKISAEELFGVLTTIGDERCTLEDCRRMIVGVDTDGDGFVCFQDFAKMMEKQG
ncbi:probable calcium-binding protein CML36 [Aristolochia californica]|uniref:probable calcium-binding protein CML36 n=1 Tax=Aristolochia californica TaxID=171875 RepID=UPI0035DF5721